MKAVIALFALFAAANAGLVAPALAPAVTLAHGPTIISRAPAFDSAVIKSDRLGGNFAYSVAENHAYAAHTPIVQQVHTPVAVTYNAAPVAVAAAPALAYHGLGYAGLGYNGLAFNGLAHHGLVAAPAATVAIAK